MASISIEQLNDPTEGSGHEASHERIHDLSRTLQHREAEWKQELRPMVRNYSRHVRDE